MLVTGTVLPRVACVRDLTILQVVGFPDSYRSIISCSEDMGGVNTYGIDGAVMASHLSDWHESIHIPEFQNAPSAATKQNRMAWHQAQGTDPVLMCIWDLLKKAFLS